MKKLITIAMCTTFLLSNIDAKAQIMYTDIAPDKTCTKSGVDDVKLTVLTQGFIFEGGGRAVFSSDPYGAVVCLVKSAPDLMYYLNAGDNIGPTGMWNVDAWEATTGATSVTDKYMGFRIKVGTSDYKYGWFRVDRDLTAKSLTIKDYAYNNTINTAIKAGDKGTATPAGPKADFSVSATTGTTATVFTFTDKSTGTPTAYKWTFTPTTVAYQGTSTATSASPSVKFTAAGTYSVKLFTSNATGKDSLTKTNLITITPTSIKDVNGNVVDFNVYPNPAQDFFMVDKAFIGSDLQIIDAQGKLVQAGKLINSKIDITNLASGLYFVKVINGEDVYTQTISVSK